MDNKEFLLKTLTTLEKVWTWATLLKKNLEENIYDDTTIEFLAEQMRISIWEVKDENVKKQIWKWLDIINEISRMEKDENIQNDEDLKKLENMFDDM
jgi:hypothetical protein